MKSTTKKAVIAMAAGVLFVPAVVGQFTTPSREASSRVSTQTSTSLPFLLARSITVQPGQTLSGIAYEFHTTVSALMRANHIANPNLIWVGQTLSITSSDTATGQAAATLPVTSARTNGTTHYTVQPGNTLGAIAAQFHVSVSQLVMWNHLANPNWIVVGQVLTINGTSGAPSAARQAASSHSSSTRYVVQAGDTLGSIAAQFHVSVAQLVAWNHLANPNWIDVGEVLTVEGSTSGSPQPAAAVAGPAQGTRYAVQAGETLSLIARKFGVSWQYLASFNHLADPNVLDVGQILLIPTTQQSQSASSSLPVQDAATNFSQAIVRTAENLLGVPYVWGGTSPATGFDCSGFVQYVFQQNGIPMPRTSWAQYSYVTKIPKSQLQPGDLVFFNTYAPGASHVGIYIGADASLGYAQAFIQDPQPGQSVMISNLNSPYFVNHYYGAGQVTP